MPPARPTSQKLKEISLRLNQAVEADSANWRLPACLVAMIVGFIQEMIETFARLAALYREGKILQQAPAPRQGNSRPAGQRTNRQGPVARVRIPRAKPEMSEVPAAAPGPRWNVRPTPVSGTERPPASPSPRACGPPKTTWVAPPPRHVHFVTIAN